jgi:hypothetical protein
MNILNLRTAPLLMGLMLTASCASWDADSDGEGMAEVNLKSNLVGDAVIYEGARGPGKGRHIVFLSGDEEYRSEEALPQMAKILAARHGFKCTVLFSINKQTGEIDPNAKDNIPGMAALDSADLCIMLWRFRELPDDQMKHFVDYFNAGKPVIALRTSTHAFNYGKDSKSAYKHFSYNSSDWKGGFGKQVLGETWVTHWGRHKSEATRGIIEPSAKGHPILTGVTDLFGDTDVYEAHPPADATILVRGQVLKGMKPTDAPADYRKKNVLGTEQAVNDPMQPIIWVRQHKNASGRTNAILTSTLGSATDLQNEGLRRLLVNAAYVYTGLEKKLPAGAQAGLIGDFKPTFYGFNGGKKGVKPADHLVK